MTTIDPVSMRQASTVTESVAAVSQAGPSSQRGSVPVSVVILTLNEEVNIGDCIASCAWSDDVHVLDSGSADCTAEIARSLGASVHFHPFESFGAQRNWAIENIEMRHDWIFHLDADERFTPELVQAMGRLIASDPAEAGFHIPQKLMFMGRWLRRSAAYPTYQMRLFHRARMRFCDYGHGQREETDGEVGVISTPYLHFGFSKGLYDWFDKHNRYSSLEALQVVTQAAEWRLRDLVTRDRVRRRRAWKELGYKLPFRPQLRWFVTLFVLGGIVEGRAGFTYASLIATYEKMTSLKLRLLRSQRHAAVAGFEKDTRPETRTAVYDAKDRPVDSSARMPTEAEAIRADGTTGAGASGAGGSGASGPGTNGLAAEPSNVLQMRPESSPWTFREKLGRAVWMVFGRPIFRVSFHNWYPFRAWLLRLFGAKIGEGVALRPTVNIEVPWMLDIDDEATVGDHAILYSLGRIHIGKRAIISQYAHLCAGTHDYTDHTFRLLRAPVTIGDDVWIGADAFVGPGVTVGRLSVLGARSSTYKDLPAKQVCVGNPARPLKRRVLQ